MANYNLQGLSLEPSTLVYTLLEPAKLPFDDFFLLIRSLHAYRVEAIVPNKDLNQVHVKLQYQASSVNAQAKLGDLQQYVAVTKMSNFVKESEFSHLEQLRRRFGIGLPDAAEPTYQPTRRQRGATRRGAATRVFASRPAPYLSLIHI